MSIIRPRVWTQQPQGVVEIDWSNPITEGLIFAVTGSGYAWSNVLGGHTLTVANGGPKTFADRPGLVHGFSTKGTGSTDRLTSRVTYPSTGKVTFITSINPVSYGGGNYGRIITTDGSTGLGPPAGISAYPLSLNPVNSFGVNYHTAGSNANACGVANSFVLGVWQTHASVIDLDAYNTKQIMYKDGVLLSGVEWNGGYTPSGSAIGGTVTVALGNRSTDNTRVFDGVIGPTFIFSRGLTAAEIKSLYDNPWQIFRPRVT